MVKKIQLKVSRKSKRAARVKTAAQMKQLTRETAVDKPSFKVRDLKGSLVYEGSLQGWCISARKRRAKEDRKFRKRARARMW